MPALVWIALAFVVGAVFPLLGLLVAAGAVGYCIASRGTDGLNQLTDVEYVEKLVRAERKRLK